MTSYLSIGVKNWIGNIIAANRRRAKFFFDDFKNDPFGNFICDEKAGFAATAVESLNLVRFTALEVR